MHLARRQLVCLISCGTHALFCILTFPAGSQILTDYEIIGVGVGGCALLIIILVIITVIIIKRSKSIHK